VYEQALNHQQTCLARPRPCKYGCGQKLLAHEYEEHEKVCVNTITLCPKCDQKFYLKRGEDQVKLYQEHDCIEFLCQTLKQLESKEELIKIKLGLEDRIFESLSCPNGKKLKLVWGVPRSAYDSRHDQDVKCSICNREGL